MSSEVKSISSFDKVISQDCSLKRLVLFNLVIPIVSANFNDSQIAEKYLYVLFAGICILTALSTIELLEKDNFVKIFNVDS